jgi:hypothetical protein
MRLRDHPLVTYSWPPVWVEKLVDTKLHGEIGTLTHLGRNEDGSPGVLFLHITHEGIPYCGSLWINNSAFRQTVHDLLRTHIGHSIGEIADLDVSVKL